MRSVMILPGRGDFGELILKDNFGGSEVKGREKMCVWVGPWALCGALYRRTWVRRFKQLPYTRNKSSLKGALINV